MRKAICWKYTTLVFSGIILLLPSLSRASFIESSLGAAVVNDATATYYNPAALTLIDKPQIIGLGSLGAFNSRFDGQVVQTATQFTQSGTTNKETRYFLPSFYIGTPASQKLTIGLAVVSNFFNRDVGETSILRYAQSNNNIQNVDFVPGFGIKLNDVVAIGGAVNISYANFVLQPTSGFPSLNIPDSQSRNVSSGTATGGDMGILIKPSRSTMIGFNYRSAITYHLSGKSSFEGDPGITSHHYSFAFWTPARSVFSINEFVTPNLGFIATIQRIQWSIFRNITIHGIATQGRGQPAIVDATVPYYLQNTWLLTLGSHYRINPKWVLRVAGSYSQSPGNGSYQIPEGNTLVLGASSGYDITKNVTLDGSYAHAFVQDASVHITTGRNRINGINSGSGNSISLKLTVKSS